MNWAWHQKIKLGPKLALMALADAADDIGVCWPSVTTVATKCNVSTRTVRRVMQALALAAFIYRARKLILKSARR
jgi:DNA-binding transcriptional regulator YhcF (GntR family)